VKRYIHGNEYIQGMAYERPKGLAILKKNSDTLSEHIIKCVVYGNDTGNYDHWIEDEIADYLKIANGVTFKGNKRPKKEDLISTLFSSFGDSEQDADTNLSQFRVDNRSGKFRESYPNFNIDEDMVCRLYQAYQAVMEYSIPILTTFNDYTKQDFEQELHTVLDKYAGTLK
jgi:hypothetical protein